MRKILEQLKKGKITVSAAEQKLREHFLDVYGVARLDLVRDHRTGVPEVVIAQDKTMEHIVKIAAEFVANVGRVIISRLTPERALEFKRHISNDKVLKKSNLIYNEDAQICILRDQKFKLQPSGGKVGIITAGTSDIPVAEEARLIVEELGCYAFTAYDIGVSGAHRLVEPLKKMVKQSSGC